MENMKFRLTVHKNLNLFKNIDIRPIYWLKSTKVCAYAYIWGMSIWFLGHNSIIFVQSEYKSVYKFRRPLAVSRAPKIWGLGMFK